MPRNKSEKAPPTIKGVDDGVLSVLRADATMLYKEQAVTPDQVETNALSIGFMTTAGNRVISNLTNEVRAQYGCVDLQLKRKFVAQYMRYLKGLHGKK